MKKIALAFCMLAGLYACSTMDAPEPAATAPADSAPVTSIVRTPEEARTLAAEAFANFYGTSRSLAHIKNVRTFTAASPSRSGAAPDTTFYVVNLDDNQGYAVIAARRDIEPVLAVTESGNIESIDSIENPGAKMFFEELDYTFNLSPDVKPIDSMTIIQPNPGWTGSGDNGENPFPNTPQYKSTTKIEEDNVEPRIPYNWGQHFPEGIYYDNGIAGCGNTACLLILSYFEQPSFIESDRFGFLSIDWESFKKHKQSFFEEEYFYDYCGDKEAPTHQLIAKLCYTIGKLNKSKCNGIKGTSTKINDVNSTLTSLRTLYFNPRPVQTGMPNAHDKLDDGILYVRGATSNNEGHAFIIDGYKYSKTTIVYYKREPGAVDWNEIDRKIEIRNYNHINWGWNGCDNGYFWYDIFDVSKGYEYDNNYHLSNPDNFTKDFKYFQIIKH